VNFSGEVCALLVDGELSPVVHDGDGEEDEVRKRTVSTRA
jgi:hypothetical protein